MNEWEKWQLESLRRGREKPICEELEESVGCGSQGCFKTCDGPESKLLPFVLSGSVGYLYNCHV